MTIKDILPKNKYGNRHGYCEIYWDNGNLYWKGAMFNDKRCGYHVKYDDKGIINKTLTGYFIDHKKVGDANNIDCCIIWNRMEL